MENKPFEQKGWGGVRQRVIGRCKYCGKHSLAEIMLMDINKRPYHKQCKELADREDADGTHTMTEATNEPQE
jgi:hypothetical protein